MNQSKPEIDGVLFMDDERLLSFSDHMTGTPKPADDSPCKIKNLDRIRRSHRALNMLVPAAKKVFGKGLHRKSKDLLYQCTTRLEESAEFCMAKIAEGNRRKEQKARK
mmetsp:Transcript_12827/g.20567  ORF Transcript_12827/g.20567 Transcript_12827/m.20567 type:complete len:108 (-) Transcript_12827:60-383(-)